MGVFGASNFENDEAQNYLGALVEELKQDIQACFKLLETGELDLEHADGNLLPPMDICVTLFENYGKKVFLSKARVRSWKQAFLQLYDDTIDEDDPKPGHKEARRQVIAATFDRFEAACLLEVDK
jgi:hypothetical protein